MADIYELRVHGVSGSRPEDMLDRPLLRQVAGDRLAGCWRPRAEHGGVTGPAGALLEGYSWGRLTSGTATRALWLLLLPFALINSASWMRPARVDRSRRVAYAADGVVRALCRLLGLAATVALVLAVAGVALDIVGWQCATRACDAGPWYLAPLGWLDLDHSRVGARLAITALVPIALIGVLWFLARRTWQRYEDFETWRGEGEGEGLAEPGFWDGRHRVARLRRAHITAALLAVALLVLFPFLPAGPMAVRVLAGVCAVLLAGCVVVVCVPCSTSRGRVRVVDAVLRGAPWTAMLVTAAALGRVWTSGAPTAAHRNLPGYVGAVMGLFWAQVVLLLVIFVALLPLRSAARHREPRPAFFGFATGITAAFGVFLISGLNAGLYYLVAGRLDAALRRPPNGRPSNGLPLHPPEVYQNASAGFLLLVLLILVALSVMWWVERPRLRRSAAKEVREDDSASRDSDGRLLDPCQAERVAEAIAAARLTDRAPVFVTAVFAVEFVHMVLVGRGVLPAYPWSGLEPFGALALGGATLGLIMLGGMAYHNPELRRTIGILWDLTTYWPRAAHPLGPPCYAERAVPELRHRLRWLAEQGTVVFSCHSQGSVLGLPVVLALPPEALPHVAWLTYGSPLERLYARYFPAYFDRATLRTVAHRLTGPGDHRPRWINLYRRTDPIGGPTHIAEVDHQPLRDPLRYGPPPGDTVDPPVLGHSGYPADPAFAQAIHDLDRRAGTRTPARTPASSTER